MWVRISLFFFAFPIRIFSILITDKLLYSSFFVIHIHHSCIAYILCVQCTLYITMKTISNAKGFTACTKQHFGMSMVNRWVYNFKVKTLNWDKTKQMPKCMFSFSLASPVDMIRNSFACKAIWYFIFRFWLVGLNRRSLTSCCLRQNLHFMYSVNKEFMDWRALCVRILFFFLFFLSFFRFFFLHYSLV